MADGVVGTLQREEGRGGGGGAGGRLWEVAKQRIRCRVCNK